jgi:hypothetical protein
MATTAMPAMGLAAGPMLTGHPDLAKQPGILVHGTMIGSVVTGLVSQGSV